MADSPYGRRPIHTIKLGRQTSEDDKLRYVDVKPKLEFGGTIGAGLLTVALPLFLVAYVALLHRTEPTLTAIANIRSVDLKSLFTFEAFLIVFAWFSCSLLSYLIPYGRNVPGRRLPDGSVLHYNCNGLIFLLIALVGFEVAYIFNVQVIDYVVVNIVQLTVASIVLSFVLSVLLFIRSLSVPKSALSDAGYSGNAIYGFFMGRELNPRIFGIDLKFTCELRPGLVGWLLIDLCACAVNFKQTGSVSPSLFFVTAAQGLYIADALWFEEAILSTTDITCEGFGFMLAFGDLAWVPFLYCSQAIFLMNAESHTPQAIPHWFLIALIALFVVGYVIFRSANLQKNNFRSQPNNASSTAMKSIATGVKDRRLLCDGWWGWVRHPNYLGDIIMAFSWSLACGFRYTAPYFYPFYLCVLLVLRAERDERSSLRKYGSAWTTYCQEVPYRIIPGIW
uniref:Delta(14)-sterol reductase n=1 Tax=Plectus sambesii TaxID=2011161 RepID=A0A914W7R9_9BILA